MNSEYINSKEDICVGNVLKNKRGEEFEILEYFKKDGREYFKIKFLSNDNIREARKEHIQTGRIRNVNDLTLNVGDVLESNNYGKVEIVEGFKHVNFNKYCKVKFLNTGNENWFSAYEIRKGNIKDLYAKTFFNIGYLGDYQNFGLKKTVIKKLLTRWGCMIKRCYDKDNHKYSAYMGKGVTVDERWFCFANYIEDVIKIQGYSEEGILNSKIQLDKDFLSNDKKIYSKDTCIWLTQQQNNELFRKGLNKYFKVTNLETNEDIIHYNQRIIRDKIGLNRHEFYSLLKGKKKSDKYKIQYIDKEMVENGI